MKNCQQFPAYIDDEENTQDVHFRPQSCSASLQNLKLVTLRYFQGDTDQHRDNLVNTCMQALASFSFESKGFAPHFPLQMTYTNIQIPNTPFSLWSIRRWENFADRAYGTENYATIYKGLIK